MSETITEIVWSKSRSCRGSRLVMLALARIANDQGHATATFDEIARSTRLTDRAVRKCVNELSALGEITHRRGGGASNPNRYSILLDGSSTDDSSARSSEVPTSAADGQEEGSNFPEPTSGNSHGEPVNRNSAPSESELSSSRARGSNTPYGSITTSPKQASLPDRRDGNTSEGPVTVPDGAKGLVAAMTDAGMLVGWRLTAEEWNRVSALVTQWGHAQLVEMVARRWNTNRPPQSARYLLRIWADLPEAAMSGNSATNVVPLRRPSYGHVPFQNTANASAYQNGF